MAAAETRIQLRERQGVQRRLHPRLSDLRQIFAVRRITDADSREKETATLDQRALPMRLRCDRPRRFRDNASLRTDATLSRSMPRTTFARVPNPARAFQCRARF